MSNDAIRRRDIAALASCWTYDFQTTSSMGRQLSGIGQNIAFYAEQLNSRPDIHYLRTPEQVEVMAAWGVAMECGEWIGNWTDADGPIHISGRYMAQWLRLESGWRIHGELFVPTSCNGGAYCLQHPLQHPVRYPLSTPSKAT